MDVVLKAMNRNIVFSLIICLIISNLFSCTTEPSHEETYHLALYSTRYQKIQKDKVWEELCVIAIKPGIDFYVEIPHNYEPSIIIQGVLNKSLDKLIGKLVITLQDPGLATYYEQKAPIPFNELIPIEDEFHFEIKN